LNKKIKNAIVDMAEVSEVAEGVDNPFFFLAVLSTILL
jgi:hypothetical protein